MSDDEIDVCIQERRTFDCIKHCCQCNGQIAVGDQAVQIDGRFDGVTFRDFSHADCHQAYMSIMEAFDDLDDGLPELQWHQWQQNEIAWLAGNFPTVHARLFPKHDATNVVALTGVGRSIGSQPKLADRDGKAKK